MPRLPFLLTSPATIPSPQPAPHSAHHQFFTPLFSVASESLFSQLLCFQNYLHRPLVFPKSPSTPLAYTPDPLRVPSLFINLQIPPCTTPLHSSIQIPGCHQARLSSQASRTTGQRSRITGTLSATPVPRSY